MKKISLLFFTIILSTIIFAQKGIVTLAVDYYKSDDPFAYNYILYPYGYYGSTYNFEPKFGYFLSNNIEVGLGFKSGDNENDYQYSSSNPSNNEEIYFYNNISKSSFLAFSPYIKYYRNNFFISARFSLNNLRTENKNTNPVWEIDSNGVYNLIGLDIGEYMSKTSAQKTTLKIGYVLKYNQRLVFEPSFGVSTTSGEVISENNNTYADGSPTIIMPQTISPISKALYFNIYLGVNLRLGK